MSDFDKEAEREKLREKFEREDERREATEQMSELLLQGATMTNAHCDQCGSPVFRHDGQEFCPTCQQPVQREGTESDGETEDDGDQIEVTSPSDEARVQFGGQTDADGTPEQGDQGEGRPETPTDVDDGSAPTSTDRATESADTSTAPREPTEPRTADAPRRRPDPSVSSPGSERSGDARADLDAARDALAATARRFAERAAATDDPREAREYLATAREAADAVDATR